jgi:translation initiation factor IF-1
MSKKNNNKVNAETLNSKDFIELQGEIIDLMPAATFKVKLESGHEILAHLSGKMRMHRIRLLPGDKVKLEMSPYDLSKGRIVFRL